MSLKQELVKTLENIAELLEFKEENPFKINAFRNGANIVRNLTDDIEPLIKDNSIKNIKGIGKGIQSVIYDYYENGKSADLENLAKDIPEGIMDLLKIHGLGVKKVKVIYNQLGITTIEQLEKACLNNEISTLKGFGEKIQESILKEIERISKSSNYMLLNEAESLVNEIKDELNKFNFITEIEITGEFRRSLEIISKLEFVIFTSDLNKIEDQLKKKYFEMQSIGIDDKFSNWNVEFKNTRCFGTEKRINVPLIFYITSDKTQFIHLLFLTTGSNQFLDFFNEKKLLKSKSEEDIFKFSGLSFLIPEMREEQFHNLPAKYKVNSDLSLEKFKGFFHFHTNFSDGRNTLNEMVNALINKGYKYLAVCDHSKSAFYANGMKEDRVLEQKKEIEKIANENKVIVYHGIESDILNDGNLDYSEDFLCNFDFIVASVHSRFQMNEEEMTKRIIKAIENQNTDVLGHPTGRLLLKRDSYKLNIKKVIDACAANNVAIEINAHPQRLDLDWRNIYYARERGCLFSINPDAHSIQEIDLIRYGIMIARKGGIQTKEVINCYDINQFNSFINRKTKRTN
jgi:DNA polymerase (family X)